MKKLLLFDVDGTICGFGKKITPDMLDMLQKLKLKYDLGIVGGGIYKKLCDQIPDIWNYFLYVCADNGNDIYRNKKNIYQNNIKNELGIDTITRINEILMTYLAQNKQIKIKTGKFFNLRRGMIYFVPVGHDCTQLERKNFTQNDIRLNIINDLKKLLLNVADLDIVLGGQLGISIFPKSWGKKIVFKYIDPYEEIIYFGDKICPHGNDYDIAMHKNVKKYHKVNEYQDTMKILQKEYL